MILTISLLERYWIKMHRWMLIVESIVMGGKGASVVLSLIFDDALKNKSWPLGMFTVDSTAIELPRPRIGLITTWGTAVALG